MRQIDAAQRYPTNLYASAVENLGDWTFSEPYLLRERQLRLDAWRRQNARY